MTFVFWLHFIAQQYYVASVVDACYDKLQPIDTFFSLFFCQWQSDLIINQMTIYFHSIIIDA